MYKIKAKFVCISNEQKDDQYHLVKFTAVMHGSEENKSFSRWTPSANLEMWISDETPAATVFEVGKEYYLDFTPTDIVIDKDILVSFGTALDALKQGKRVARNGWNGKGMFIFMRPADQLHIEMVVDKVKSLPQSVKDFYAQDITDNDGMRIPSEMISISDNVKFTAYLCLKAADGTVVNGWLASQTDMLSEDWCILD